MNIDSTLVDIEEFQSPTFIVGQAPETLGSAIKPLIAEAMERGYCVSIVSSFENFSDLVETGVNLIYHTLGKFGVAPMAVNCFEVPNGRMVVSHAHKLAAIVGKIYDLSETDISVLRSAIEKAYSKRGWNLLTNTNFRTDGQSYQSDMFPCWSDVSQQIPNDMKSIDEDLNETREFGNRLPSVIDDLVGPLNSLVFISGKTSMQKLSEGNHICDMSSLMPQAQLLASWCIGSWTSLYPPSPDRVTNKRLIVMNLSEDVSRIQEANSKGPLIFNCADEWSNNAAVLTLSRKWSLSRADQFRHGSKIINLEGSDAGAQKPQTQIEIDHAVIRNHWLANELRIEPLVSHGEKFLPQAFLADLYGSVSNLLSSKALYQIYVRYLLAVQNDPTQVVHYRKTLVTEIDMQLGRKLLNKMHVTWLMLSLFTDRFFRENAEMHSWTLEIEEELRSAWYTILFAAFVNSEEKQLKIDEVNSFRQRLHSFQDVEVGPFVGCRFCKTRCQFGHAVSVQMDDNIRSDFNVAINRSDEPPSCSGAWSVRLTSESWINCNNIDLAYCLAVHQLKTDAFSRESNLAILYKIRETLTKLDEEYNYEVDTSEN